MGMDCLPQIDPDDLLATARSMNVPTGKGIAGRVAKNGYPLLVADIEKDRRVGIPNRPRFRTKSFISIPLQSREKSIGVLNLADKAEDGIFSDDDLNLPISFANQTPLMQPNSVF